MITRNARLILVLLSSAALALPPVQPLATANAVVAPNGEQPNGAQHNADPAGGEPRAPLTEAQKQERRQRRARERQRKAENLRRTMSSLGFDDRALQDEVLRYIVSEVRARGQVRRQGQQLYTVLRDSHQSDAQVRAALSQYQGVVEADRARRREAENTLNDRIGFRSKPRLEAMLVLFGVIGNAPLALPRPQ